MKTKVVANTSFMHGRTHAHAGDEIEVTKGEADELISAGLVRVKEEAGEQTATEVQPEDIPPVDVEELLGGEKMADQPRNKMEPPSENKAEDATKAARKNAKKAD